MSYQCPNCHALVFVSCQNGCPNCSYGKTKVGFLSGTNMEHVLFDKYHIKELEAQLMEIKKLNIETLIHINSVHQAELAEKDAEIKKLQEQKAKSEA